MTVACKASRTRLGFHPPMGRFFSLLGHTTPPNLFCHSSVLTYHGSLEEDKRLAQQILGLGRGEGGGLRALVLCALKSNQLNCTEIQPCNHVREK